MSEKHAYLIMAHHRPDLLQLLIDALDDRRNDIFIHIDKKSRMQPEQFQTNKASLIFINRINVQWAGYSQVECEFRLLEAAVSSGNHSYYHMMTGVSYPLWNQDVLHNFFEENSGFEYIGFDNAMDYSDRARYYYLFSEYGKLKGVRGRLIGYIRNTVVRIQKILKINRLKNTDFTIKKGCAYWSVTSQFAKYLLNQEEVVKELLNKTIWCDEVFVQTIVFNSIFRDKILDLKNEFDGAMRELAWPSNVQGSHPGRNFSMNDVEYLLNSKRLFALKFESQDSIELIKRIKTSRGI